MPSSAKPRAVLASTVVLAAVCTGLAYSAIGHSWARRPKLKTGQEIVLCHATGSGKWVRLGSTAEGVLNGHAGHSGDIVPPFDHTLANGTTGSFPGLN